MNWPVVWITLGIIASTKGVDHDAGRSNKNFDFPLNSKLKQRNTEAVEINKQKSGYDIKLKIPPVLPLPDYGHDENLLDILPFHTWSQWSLCSRSCGGGVAMRSRICGGRAKGESRTACEGSELDHKLCNVQKCIGEKEDFRQYQCSLRNNQLFQSRKFKWVPYSGTDGPPCELACMVEEEHFFNTFGAALDGTRCGIDSKDICISGECVKVGCDLIVGSNTREDACGVCGGNNSTCFYYKNVFRQLLPNAAKDSDYNAVARIPAGATNVLVKDFTKNYIALLEIDEHYGARYVINGNWVISWPGQFRGGGTTVTYKRAGSNEYFRIKGPTIKDLHIMILFLGYEPNIEYEYWIPNSLRPGYFTREREELRAYEERIEIPQDLDYYEVRYPDEIETSPTTSTTTTTTIHSTTSTSTTTSTTTTSTTTTPTTTLSIFHNNLKNASSKGSPQMQQDKPDYCTPCKRPRNRRKHFCKSDFVIHARVTSKRRLQHGRYVRYDLRIFSTYKSEFKLMDREYIWVPSTCCPKLRVYRQYLLMGKKLKVDVTRERRGKKRKDSVRRYETRLVLDHSNYWHQWRKSYENKMARMATNIKCRRFLNRSSPESLGEGRKSTR